MKGQAWARVIFVVLLLLVIGLVLFAIFSETYGDFQIPTNFKNSPRLTGFWATLFSTLGLPDEWLHIPVLIYFVLIPVLGVTAIVYGFLDAINIFKVNVNFIIALLIGLSLMPLGLLVRVVGTMFVFMGTYATFVFGALFFFGVGFVFFQKMYGWGWASGPTFRGTQLSERYDYLVSWLRQVITYNSGTADPPVREIIEQGIPKILKETEKEWKAGHVDTAVRKLEQYAKGIRGRKRTLAGLNLPTFSAR